METHKIPEIGMGCTYGAGSDQYPATIINVESYRKIPNGKITIQDDILIVIPPEDGKTYQYGDNIPYKYESNIHGATTIYTLRKNNRYIKQGRAIKDWWCSLSIGYRRYYQDPHF